MKFASSYVSTGRQTRADVTNAILKTVVQPMRTDCRSPPANSAGEREADSLFHAKPIAEIRMIETTTRKQIEEKQQELRELIGNKYRDLIDSADTIIMMKGICESISGNITSICSRIGSLSAPAVETPRNTAPDVGRGRVYGDACRVKYLVDTPESIWGCLDEWMLLEGAARYIRAKQVYLKLLGLRDRDAIRASVHAKPDVAVEANQVKTDDRSADSGSYNAAGEGDGSATEQFHGRAGAADDYRNAMEHDHSDVLLRKFPLLQHHWQMVESFKVQISQRSRDRLLVQGLRVSDYANALAAASITDQLKPREVFNLFLETRKSWIRQKMNSFRCQEANAGSTVVVSLFCDAVSIIQITIGHAAELFLQVSNDTPLFYDVILSSPPGLQLFGGIPNPEEEMKMWKSFSEELENVMVVLDKSYIAKTCSSWVKHCGGEMMRKMNGRALLEAIETGEELAFAEKRIREAIDDNQVLEGSLGWLQHLFGSEICLPWNRMRELVLEEDDSDLWDEIFEDAFVQRMKWVIELRYNDLIKSMNLEDSIHAIGEEDDGEITDFQAYINRPFMEGGVWYRELNSKKPNLLSSRKVSHVGDDDSDLQSSLDAYLGADVSLFRDAVDSSCKSILEELLCFLASPMAAVRLLDLVPFLQDKCYDSISTILKILERELDNLSSSMDSDNLRTQSMAPMVVIKRCLFIGRLLFAFLHHAANIRLILGSPRSWGNVTKSLVANGKQISKAAMAALVGASESSSWKREEFAKNTENLYGRAYGMWISWYSDGVSVILSDDLAGDEGLSSMVPLRGWEEAIIKQELPDGNPSEIKVSLPSLPSVYVIRFLFHSCAEIHRIGGHVLDKNILRSFSLRLLEKVVDIYQKFLSNSNLQISDKGALQILLDLRFLADVLSVNLSSSKRHDNGGVVASKSAMTENLDGLINRLKQRLDPIDWLTYEPYLWENEKNSYLRHAVLFGFFVQLSRTHTNTTQKLPTSSYESNIMRSATIPRFKYLPISTPAATSRTLKTCSPSSSSGNSGSRDSSWKAYAKGEMSPGAEVDGHSGFAVATPTILKSFMEAGSRFGESTLKLSAMLADGQVGLFKDKSAAAMSSFSDIFPSQAAAGLLSSFTSARSPDSSMASK